jgi:hypothetical protein
VGNVNNNVSNVLMRIIVKIVKMDFKYIKNIYKMDINIKDVSKYVEME